jgi:hypothetical protein
MRKSNAVAFRPDNETKEAMEEWLAKNPSIDRTTLINMAVSKFVHEAQILEPVMIKVSNKNALDMAKKAMKKHKRAIDELK